ncbi:twin-arginine translocase TatA/TatE family subunit [Paenibacillus beijingensis]|uniref:Sec-independent protein translocase protein TatA n=1 Tax=Paenibacillus beijingensis TaxID=1126833 RepID=A0A0D5NF95_9BACL|nr:twin-arginine translocase TatA/TatE family subunit [Paenibacillus beijingensis]AJY73921.1 prohead protease [Paenibacillus beijingensis]
MFGGIGATGFLLLAIIALLLFGPNKLPELGRAFGRTLREFKAGTRDLIEDDSGKSNASQVDVTRADEQDNKRLPD